jgi:hypothetical protein
VAGASLDSPNDCTGRRPLLPVPRHTRRQQPRRQPVWSYRPPRVVHLIVKSQFPIIPFHLALSTARFCLFSFPLAMSGLHTKIGSKIF